MIRNGLDEPSNVGNSCSNTVIACPKCHSTRHVIKRGVRRNKSGVVQRFLCKRCDVKFIPRTGFEKMKHTANVITVALDLFFKGLSLSKIMDHLQQFHDTHVSDTTVYRWILKYIILMSRHLDGVKPQLSERWHADETCLKVSGKNEYMWSMLDSKTRFLIATQVTTRRGGKEAKRIVRQSFHRTGNQPRIWITDGLSSYKQVASGMRKNSKMVHISGRKFADKGNNNLIERFHGTVKERTKVMRGFRNDKTASLFAKGYRIYYNFVRPHKTLKGKTPAEAAGLPRPRTKNRWLAFI